MSAEYIELGVPSGKPLDSRPLRADPDLPRLAAVRS